MPATTDLAVAPGRIDRLGGGLLELGVSPALAMRVALAGNDPELVAKAAMAAIRLADAESPLAERELRPLGDILPGWYAYRGPDKRCPSGNVEAVMLALREDAVLRRLGHLPDRPTTLVSLPGPTPEES